MIHLGVIGFGGRGAGISSLVHQHDPTAKVVAITDVRNEAIRKYAPDQPWIDDKVAFFTDPDEMMKAVRLDGVIIATRCQLHAGMAMRMIPYGLPIYLEKPVATNWDDLYQLRQIGLPHSRRIVVSFPLRVTPLVRTAKEILDSGRLGDVVHVQAWCYVTYGRDYYMNWYRDENETGGLFLQKATHDFDYVTHLLGLRPVRVCATTSKQIFKGDKPAGLRCKDCSENRECLESPLNRFLKGRVPEINWESGWSTCCFAVDTGNEDSGSALVEYEKGLHLNYSQCFVPLRGGSRGARFFGYLGTLDFDWDTNVLTVTMNHEDRTDTCAIGGGGSHGGGDDQLVENFLQIIRGKEESISPLEAGLNSILICLNAKESSLSHEFREIRWEKES